MQKSAHERLALPYPKHFKKYTPEKEPHGLQNTDYAQGSLPLLGTREGVES